MACGDSFQYLGPSHPHLTLRLWPCRGTCTCGYCYYHTKPQSISYVYLLGQVPRSLWNASRRMYTLNHCYFKAAKLCTDMSDADEKLSEAVEVQHHILGRI